MHDINRRTFLRNTLAAGAAAAQSRASEGVPVPQGKLRVALIGCGALGQNYAQSYRCFPDTELVAIAEWNPDRRRLVGEHFGVKALYRDAPALLRDIVPDVAAVVLPAKFAKEAVIACAEAGVKGVSTEKPMAARLSDADEMVDACAKRGVVFGGANMERARHQVQEAARRLHAGEFGELRGVIVHRFGNEIVGGGCQHISLLRLFARAEVTEVIAWGSPPEALAKEDDTGLNINGRFILSSGLECPVFGTETPATLVDVWTDQALIHCNWDAPKIWSGTDSRGARQEIAPNYQPFPWFSWDEFLKKGGPKQQRLVNSVRSFLAAVRTGSQLWSSGHDLRQALEVAIACKLSAQLGNIPVRLPLKDRSLALLPAPWRWAGRDATGIDLTGKYLVPGDRYRPTAKPD